MSNFEGDYNKYEYWLAGMFSLSGRKKIYLKTMFGDAKTLYRAKAEVLERIPVLNAREKEKVQASQSRTEEELQKSLEYCVQNGILLTSWQDKSYPERLENIYNPPYGLFYRGNLPEWQKPSVGIVGARNCTYYGKTVAEQIGERLAAAGIVVVSGMAAGIDGAAQRGALRSGGSTCSVLGCGMRAF